MFPTSAELPRPFAHGYRILQGPPAVDISGLYPYPWAAGAIISTARDVATFYRALLTARLLRPDLLRAMKTTIAEGDKVDIPGQRAGLGLGRFPTSCGPAWGGNGDIPGYYSYAFTSADGRRQAVLTVNQDAMSLPPAAGKAFLKTLERAFCAAL